MELTDKNLTLFTSYRITSADTDMDSRLRLGGLVNLFIQSAISSADSFGFGFGGIKQQQLFWVLSRMTIEITRPLNWYEEAVVETWLKNIEGIIYLRDFIVRDKAGEIVAMATSAWLAIDLKTKRPKRIEGLDADLFVLLKDKHALRRNYGMVLQDTWLKNGTVRENINIGKPNATDEEIITAAKEAHSWEFIRRLPGKLDAVLNEDSLSQGQKQLLCITRVMLCLPPMLILDEATSSIDTRTEMLIQSAFDKLMEGRTSFIVAHRLSTIRNADIILVMKDGKIIEQGNHEQLMAKNGFYTNLYNSQFALEQ